MKSSVLSGSRFRLVGFTMLLFCSMELLTACVPILVGAATVTAVNVATDRRSLSRNIDDNSLELHLRKDMLLDDRLKGNNISVTAMNGIVLLTGEVASDKERQIATEVAKEYEDTVSVVNELLLAGNTSITSRANDSFITGQVKAKLLSGHGVPANAVKVVTEGGKVYLLGLVTQSEAEAAVDAAQQVGGVTHIVKVFEYIK